MNASHLSPGHGGEGRSSATRPQPGVAAVLSFVIPGLGQFYNGRFWRGVFWLILTPGLWLGSGGTLGWICHVVSAYTAYNYARKVEREV